MTQRALWDGRTIAWFSCGTASAVAAKLAVDERPDTLVIYNDLSASEHSDNARFLRDVERWIGKPITKTHHPKWSTIDEVFETQRYLVGRHGAPCTRALKRDMRDLVADFNDVNVLGFTADEGKRIADFERHDPDVKCWWILRDQGITKADCHRIVEEAGIALPRMYSLGFEHNNCIGCVKSRSRRYWNLVRRHFPETFKRRADQERRFGYSLIPGVYLDELSPDATSNESENIDCGPFCRMT